MLHSVDSYLETDVSGLVKGLIIKGQVVHGSWTDILS